MKSPEKTAEGSGTKLNLLFSKLLGESEKSVLYFLLKNQKKLYGQPNKIR